MDLENKITFIIPSINRPTLKRSINSLINQNNPNWECIIIYDGVDGEKFNDKRIKKIKIEKTGNRIKNIGQSGLVRNYGLKEVKTKWVGFLDDDDTIDPNYVNDLFMKYSDYDLVIWRMKTKNGTVIPKENNNKISYGNIGISFCYKLLDNELLFDENKNGEDYNMVKKILSKTNNFIVASEIYYKIRH